MRPALAVLFLTVLVLAGAVALWPVPVLLVRAEGPRRILWAQPIRGETVPFVLEYTHSVERTPVREAYEVDTRGLRLVRMEFVSQGAGLPSSGYTREGDRFVLRTVRLLSVLRLRVSAAAGARLSVAGRRLDLLALAGDGRAVTIVVASRPRLAVLLGVLY